MAEIGFSLSPFAISTAELAQLARETEDAGYAGVFVPEGNNDGLISCYAIAQATRRTKIGSWISNIYFRQPNLCAAGAALVQEAADGRFILGLGVSHRYTLGNLGIEMGNARERLRSYTATLRKMFAGEPVSAEFPMRLRAIPKPIPIYYGALTIETARLGGELADGLLLYLCSPKRMRDAIAAASQSASSNGRKPDGIAVTVGLPAFVDEDRGRALQAARMGLAFYASLPFFNRILSRNGFEAEAKAAAEAAAKRDFAAMGSALSEQLLDSLALVGPPAKCLERLAEYREMGGKFPIIVPNTVNETYVSCVRKNLNVFGRAIRA